VVEQDLARRDADLVVRAGDVDDVRRVHVEVGAPGRPLRQARGDDRLLQLCGSPQKNCTRSAPRDAPSASGSAWSTWAPILSPLLDMASGYERRRRGAPGPLVASAGLLTRTPSCHGSSVAAESTGGGGSLASLRTDGHPRPGPGGAHHRSLPRHVPQRHPQRWRDGREDRCLGAPPALLRDRQEDRGHLRRHRPHGRAGHDEGARPPAEPERVDPAHEGHATELRASKPAPAKAPKPAAAPPAPAASPAAVIAAAPAAAPPRQLRPLPRPASSGSCAAPLRLLGRPGADESPASPSGPPDTPHPAVPQHPHRSFPAPPVRG
jgi:pyruvate/2-oxoglutarate dehydrogenase complex dihydrolipoamide acyltransferase (E2) component